MPGPVTVEDPEILEESLLDDSQPLTSHQPNGQSSDPAMLLSRTTGGGTPLSPPHQMTPAASNRTIRPRRSNASFDQHQVPGARGGEGGAMQRRTHLLS